MLVLLTSDRFSKLITRWLEGGSRKWTAYWGSFRRKPLPGWSWRGFLRQLHPYAVNLIEGPSSHLVIRFDHLSAVHNTRLVREAWGRLLFAYTA